MIFASTTSPTSSSTTNPVVGRLVKPSALPEEPFLVGREGRTALVSRLENAMRRPGTSVTIFLLDLRRFHAVNARFGQSAGDHLLAQVALRLRSHLSNDSVLAHLSGDEFALVIENLERETEILRLAERLQRLLEVPFQVEQTQVFLSARQGIARSDAGNLTANDLLRNASTALRHAQQMDRPLVVFQPHHHRQAVDRFDLENELREALDQHQLRLRYQPIVELPSGRPVGIEALIRWRHPKKGLLTPDAFLPAISESRLASRVDRWVLDEAIRQLAIWRGEGWHFPPLSLSVNVSGQHLADPDLPSRLAEDLAATALEPAALKLEITEERLPEQRESIYSTLKQLTDLGIGLHLDDFGTGYAYLSRLHRVSSEALKIDRSFIANMLTDPIHREIVRGLIELAQRLGIQTIAEGVEQPAQIEYLAAWGCTHVQGYLISPPISGEAIPLWLEQQGVGRASMDSV